jgi:hypothetical protein
MDERKQQLLALKEAVFSDLTVWNKKHLHYCTVSNLIEHFDRIKNEDDEAWIFNSLQTYLMFCKGMNEEINRSESNSIYMAYLDKLCNYYRYNLDFRMVVGRVTDVLLFATTFVSLFLILNIYTALLSIPLFVWNRRRIVRKVKRQEAYGVFY